MGPHAPVRERHGSSPWSATLTRFYVPVVGVEPTTGVKHQAIQTLPSLPT